MRTKKSDSPLAKRIAKELKETHENRRWARKLRKLGASDYEISKALGVPETNPVIAELPSL